MRHQGTARCRFDRGQRLNLSAKLAGLALLLAASGCRSSKPADPANVYAEIRAESLKGHLDAAQQAAFDERTRLAGRNPEWSYRFRLLEAEILSYQGHSQDVIRVLGDGGGSFVPAGDLAVKQGILLSGAYARVGQAQRSSEELEKAKRLSAETHSALEGEVLRTEGLLQDRRGDRAAAVASYVKSLEYSRKEGNAFLEASDLLNLGKAALEAQKIDEALDRFNASTRIAQSISANVMLQTDLGNAGWAYYELGDFEKALDSFRQAREQARTLSATDNEILWTENEGLALYRLDELKQAQGLFEEALRAALETHDTARVAELQTDLGLLFLQLDQFESAKTHADAALVAAHEVGDKLGELDIAVLRGLLAVRQSYGVETERTLFETYKAVSSAPSQRWAIENALAGMYAGRHQSQKAELWYRRAIATFEAQRASVHDEELRLPFFANSDALYRDYAEYLIASGRPDRALQTLDEVHARTLEEGLAHTPPQLGGIAAAGASINPPSVARKLDATILFYSLGPRKSCLWAIDGNRIRFVALPPEAEIAAHVKSYQSNILQSSDPLRDADTDGQWLYNTLVAPTEDAVRANGRVFVIPSGSLNTFNMETLLKPGAHGLHYWIEDVRITSANSIRLLARFAANEHAAKSKAGKLLLIGDPLVQAGQEYAPLLNAASEVERVQRYFPAGNRTVLTQAAAVPEAYAASGLEQASYIHFVAHGTASSLRPLDSAILLSPPQSHPDSYKLYARDIVHRPLHAQLVTISACYGSGLRNYKGEGLVGLSWAFLRAGAHHVIGALWEVNDSSTPQLMDDLYRGLMSGQESDDALRRAKLSMVHADGVYRKPLYWAAFQLYAGS
jgi:CHAT domain-containing protein/tetratricopeptide (TPR) repeat protein